MVAHRDVGPFEARTRFFRSEIMSRASENKAPTLP